MDDRKLRVFLSVSETKSFSRTAAAENCTQSAVTQMMSALEDELGCRLFERSHTGTSLTPDGKVLLPEIRKAYAAITDLQKKADALHDNEARTIHIGTLASMANNVLPGIIKEYRKSHPDIMFDIQVENTELPLMLENGTVDIALGDKVRLPSRHWIPILTDPYCAVLPEGYVSKGQTSITHSELARYPLIVAPGTIPEHYFDVVSETKLTVNSYDDSTLLSLVATGLGVTVLPRLSLGKIPDGVIVLEPDPLPTRILGAALSDNAGKSVKEFAEFLRKFKTVC